MYEELNSSRLSQWRSIVIQLGAFCLFSFWIDSAWAAPPNSVQLSYNVYKGGLKIGRIDESYTRDKDRYTLSSTTRAVGLLSVIKPGRILITSSGFVGANGLQPLHFSDQREGEERRNRRAEFDWEKKQLTLIHHDQRSVISLPNGTQDRLSAMYQFMFLSLQPSTTLDFPMTNGGKLDNYHFAVFSREKIKTPAGEFTTLYLDTQARKGETRTEIWLATDRHNLPCKMTVTDADGGEITQELSQISIVP